MTKTDPLTGLPEVPEGYFWEVTPAYTQGLFRLKLRKKLFWIFNETVEWTIADDPMTDSSLYEDALYLLSLWRGREQAAKREADTFSRYVGKYPPKTLKDTK